MTIRNNSFVHVVSLLAVAAIAGCSASGNLLTPDRIDYKSAGKKDTAAPTLDVPPDLSQISRDNRYSIPDNRSGTLTASGFNNKNAAVSNQPAAVAQQATIAPNSLEGMRIERDGTQRWLLVPQSADMLWPKLKKFWQDNGFTIIQESEATGTLQTDWLENRANIPDDFLRRTIGKVFDSLYSTGERDQFRTRLERRTDGSTEIYISHRGAHEVTTGSQNESTAWTNRPNDPGLESAFLIRLMVSLGTTPEKASVLAGAPVEAPAKARLVKDGATSKIDIDEPFDHAWRRVGLALDRVGFTVEDRDRNKGIYFVRYVDADGKDSNEGFLSKIFSFEKDKEAKRYRIMVAADKDVTHVTVQNNDGGAETSAASEKILTVVLEQVK
jgi:outer membrane protein assembly factor BamC